MYSSSLDQKPKFSVLMANYNNIMYVGKAIESVLSQTFEKWELVIIDDASTDGSIEMMGNYLHDKRICLRVNKANVGYIKTLNRLVNESHANIFGILDSDDALTPDALAIMYEEHFQNPDCGLIYSQFLYCDTELKPIKKGFCKQVPESATNLQNTYTSHFKTFKKEMFNLTEGFDNNIIYAEDWDIVFKMEEVAPVLFVDRVLYKHRVRTDSQSNDPLKKRIGHLSYISAEHNAYIRRMLTDIPTLSRHAMSVELFRASVLSLRLFQWYKVRHYFTEAFKLNPFLFLSIVGYSIVKIMVRVKRYYNPHYKSPFPVF